MDGFNVIDAIVAVVLVLSAVLAYARGLTREVMSIVGWIGAAIVGFIFADEVAPLMREVPVLGGFLAGSCELTVLVAFTAVFAVALIVISFFTPLLSNLLEHLRLGRVDQGLGLVFGLLRGILLVALAFVVYARLGEGVDMVDESRSAAAFSGAQVWIEARLPEEAPDWIIQTYERLMASCPVPDGPPRPETVPG
ncbi:MAG: CvpA family protein [Rhodobacteraceae bacterium]|jgi:membrane protein required for colicin V production|nr:CvpA family protein [Paracoccaceae bacterium]MBL4559131.1 CvpA family protein [Paracoccaceae bacterium]HBG99920.1 colicin V production CvpA [Paracoccaceae bacterium]